MVFMAVVNGRVCVEVPEGTAGAFQAGGTYWIPERDYERMEAKQVG